MRILIATDAWHPQVNGVVRTLTKMAEAAAVIGVDIQFLTPQSFRTISLPSYADIQLALPWPGKVARMIEEAQPDYVHIATEGPIGILVRRYCLKNKVPFTTSFHTRFPEYVSARFPIPESWIWAALRYFHGSSDAVMAATPALADELRGRGFSNVVLWSRGVDADLFRPRDFDLALPRPVFLSVGRVAVEKISKRSSNSICPARKSWSATAPRAWSLSANSPTRCSSAPCRGSGLLKLIRQPMYSSSPARRTPSAWCCLKRSPAACPWRLCRCRVRWM